MEQQRQTRGRWKLRRPAEPAKFRVKIFRKLGHGHIEFRFADRRR
jgi:hypothetical protein